MSNPYDRPPLASKGDDDVNDIYRSVGKALSTWEALETAQASLYGFLIQNSYGVAAAVYGLANNAQAKRDMITTALEWVLSENKDLTREITTAVNMTVKLSARRADIAHGRALSLTADGREAGCFLIPGIHATKHVKTMDLLNRPKGTVKTLKVFVETMFSYAYTSDQILAFADHFAAHEHHISLLREKLKAARSK
ncbi:MAG: hypothetical protein ACK4S3_06460 [Parvibaculum sp.]